MSPRFSPDPLETFQEPWRVAGVNRLPRGVVTGVDRLPRGVVRFGGGCSAGDASPSAVDSSCLKVLGLRISSAGTIACRVCAVFSLTSQGCLWNVGLGPDSRLTQAPLRLCGLGPSQAMCPHWALDHQAVGCRAGVGGVAPASDAATVMEAGGWMEVGGGPLLKGETQPSRPGQGHGHQCPRRHVAEGRKTGGGDLSGKK